MMPVVNKMAVWLATFVVAGLVLLVSSTAQAHVAHDGGAAANASEFRMSVDPEAHERAESAGGISTEGPEARVSLIADHGDAERQGAKAACCGTGISGCASVVLAQTAPALRFPSPVPTDASSMTPSLKGTTVDGLIRPPRASV